MFKVGFIHAACICAVVAAAMLLAHLVPIERLWSQLIVLAAIIGPWSLAARVYKQSYGPVIFAPDGNGVGRLARYAAGGGLLWAPVAFVLASPNMSLSLGVLAVLVPIAYVLGALQVAAYILLLGILWPANDCAVPNK